MRVSVVGSGYVGLITAAGFAEKGHEVICVDIDKRKVEMINARKPPIYEKGLQEILDHVVPDNLSASLNLEESVLKTDATFICVGTPPLENGEADLFAVEKVTREVAAASDSYKLVVEKSTVPVQTGEYILRTLQMYCREENGHFDVASNPEFLREGSAVHDFFHPGLDIKQGRCHI